MLNIQTSYVYPEAFGRMAAGSGNVLSSPVGTGRASDGEKVNFVSLKTGAILATGEVIRVRSGWVDIDVQNIHD